MADIVERLRVRREAGYSYFVRGRDVWRVPLAGGLGQVVRTGSFVPDEQYVYFVDRAGDVARVRRRSARPARGAQTNVTLRDEQGAATGGAVPPSPPLPLPPIGAVLRRRFRIERPLGKGGFSKVFLACDELTPERPVALKFAIDQDSALLLEREFDHARHLRHHNICSYRDLVKDDGYVAILMEYGGRSIYDLIHEGGPQPKERVLLVARGAAEALDYAHHKAFRIHHDVNPGNILLDEDDSVRLTDFGVSSHLTMRAVEDGRVTGVARDRIGFHRAYCAPEVRRGDDARCASDQYSLALVLCSMLVGRVFVEPGAGVPHDLSRVSPAQDAALRRALAEAPSDRFANCAAFAAALGAA